MHGVGISNYKLRCFVCIGSTVRWRVQLGINSTGDVWKSCQNWTSCRGGVGIFRVKPVELSPPS